jgi:hypothetical protein
MKVPRLMGISRSAM